MQVPKLRFKEFTDNWEYCIIKDTFENISIKNHPEMTILTIIQGNGTIPRNQSNRNIIFDEEKSFTYKVVNKNDFIIHLRSFEGGLEMSNYDGIVSPAYTILRGNDKVIPSFFKYYFRTNKFINGILSKAVEGIRDGRQISYNQLKDFNIPLPSLEEQTKISNFLSLIDKKIELQTQLVDNLNLYKKGLLQKVFSNNSGWKTVKLKNYFDITSSKRVFQSEWTTKGVPFYRAREIVKLVNNGYVDNELFISKSMYDEYSKKYGKIKKNDLLITGVGTIGICYLVKETDEFYFKDGNLIWLKPKSNNINSNFVKYLFKSNYIINQINDFGNGTTVATYTIDNANETKIIIPNIEEQNRIAELFSSIDDKISYETKKLENLKTYKKGLLQQMFI